MEKITLDLGKYTQVKAIYLGKNRKKGESCKNRI
jgi:hypothetical protein